MLIPQYNFLLLNLLHENFGGLESWDFVLWDDDSGLLRDVPGNLLRTSLNDEATKTSQINVLTLGERVLYGLHEFLNSLQN